MGEDGTYNSGHILKVGLWGYPNGLEVGGKKEE